MLFGERVVLAMEVLNVDYAEVSSLYIAVWEWPSLNTSPGLNMTARVITTWQERCTWNSYVKQRTL